MLLTVLFVCGATATSTMSCCKIQTFWYRLIQHVLEYWPLIEGGGKMMVVVE